MLKKHTLNLSHKKTTVLPYRGSFIPSSLNYAPLHAQKESHILILQISVYCIIRYHYQ